ncbi:DUF2244 domain-containing protein [Sandarakinorhabdus oryzae]|uniref:DUF2244 domain-containing protein n=1 Tax=Sandarakinorhabdus oryzae TaxID=2675220 RepID=UPI0018CC2426|nr:DUF2244 domain-containing protein [Sandarakinorhabdus oryzae]
MLDLTLRPNRSLTRANARTLVLAVGGLFLIGSIRFLVLGLWPVIPFMIADVALLAWAFRSNYRSGGAHERLVLAGDALTLTRVNPWGEEVEHVLEPFFTRVDIEETPLGDALLFLNVSGRRLRVGQFLSAPERREVGALIREALARYRNQRPSTSVMA